MNWRLATAFMTGSADGFSINGDDPGWDAGYRGNPGNEAALELLSVENGQNVPEVVVRRGAILERAKDSLRGKFKRAGWNDAYLTRLLALF